MDGRVDGRVLVEAQSASAGSVGGRSSWCAARWKRQPVNGKQLTYTACYSPPLLFSLPWCPPPNPNPAPRKQAASELDASTKLPADAAAQQHTAQLVVGSLDINQGAVLPAEDLVGRLPSVGGMCECGCVGILL